MSHAILSASAAHRWMACPPSARLAQQYKNESSVYAAEGTAAHALAEYRLGKQLDLLEIPCAWSHEEPRPSEHHGPEMNDYIGGYVDTLTAHIQSLKEPYVLLEQVLDMSDYVPQGYGTGDVIILSEHCLEIVDLKYGKGVPVDATWNPQLMLYGLGALLLFGPVYGVKTVSLRVEQPRLNSSSVFEITEKELMEWAEHTLRPAALQAWEGKGEYGPSEEACRFCPAAGECRARAEMQIKLAQEAFQGEPPTLRDDEIADLLGRVDDWMAWAKALKESALDRALHEGARFPGYKLVLGRSTRRYNNKQTVMDVLEANGHSLDDVAPREPLGITAMTKLLGKKRFENELGNLIGYMSGKPTLVPESDKRAVYDPAAEAFRDFKD